MMQLMKIKMKMNINADNTNIIVAITTLLVTFIMKKCEFDNIYYGLLYTVVLQFLTKTNTFNYNIDISYLKYLKYLCYLLVPIVILSGVYYYSKNKKTRCVKLSICNSKDIEIFNEYMKDHQQ